MLVPSTSRWVGVGLAVLVVAYAVIVAQRILLGVLLAAVVYLVAWLTDRLSHGDPLADMSRERMAVTGGIVLLVLGYSVFVVASILLGVAVAATVMLVAWVTNPAGPVADWLDRRG